MLRTEPNFLYGELSLLKIYLGDAGDQGQIL